MTITRGRSILALKAKHRREGETPNLGIEYTDLLNADRQCASITMLGAIRTAVRDILDDYAFPPSPSFIPQNAGSICYPFSCSA